MGRRQRSPSAAAIKRGDQARRLLLTRACSQGQLLPSAWASLTNRAAQGIGHALAGPDHLLFLLAVLLVSG